MNKKANHGVKHMKIKLLALLAVAAAGVVAIQLPVTAHHAFSAEWINPHTWIHLENSDPEATRDPGPWMVEGGTPNTLLRRGINRNSLVLGTDIVVTGYQSKDRLCEPTCRANGRDITFPDGRKLFMGSSGTGAPRDGTDATEPQ